MKILVFAHTPPPHHGQSYMVQLLLKALRADPSVTTLHINARFSGDVQEIGQMNWAKPFLLFRYLAQALAIRLKHGSSVLFYYIPAPGMRVAVYRDWLVLSVCRRLFRKSVFHWHAAGLGQWTTETARGWEAALTRAMAGRADLSIILGEYYRADVALLNPKAVAVIPNFAPDPCPDFNTNLLPHRQARLAARRTARTAPDGKATPFQILYLSLCIREKGLFDVVEGVRLANEQLCASNVRLTVTLAVAGKFYRPEEEREFDAMIASPKFKSPGGSPMVTYLGFLGGDRKDAAFIESDCCALPSYYPMEAQPVSLVEAMAYGLPIITTRWRALPDLFPPGYAGLVDAQAPAQIARCITQFIDEDRSAEMRALYLNRFTEAHFVANMKSALSSI